MYGGREDSEGEGSETTILYTRRVLRPVALFEAVCLVVRWQVGSAESAALCQRPTLSLLRLDYGQSPLVLGTTQ